VFRFDITDAALKALFPIAVLAFTLPFPLPTVIPYIFASSELVKLPVIITLPFISNLAFGLIVPIPTLVPLSNNELVVNVVALLNFAT